MSRKIAWLLCLCLLAGLFAAALAEEVLDSGVDGNITWKIVGRPNAIDPSVMDRILVLGGSGAMRDFDYPRQGCAGTQLPPWFYNPTYNPDGGSKYGASFRGIEIGAGITSIGSCAFWPGTSSNSIDEVVIPYGVTSIGDNAFYGQYHLKQVVVPDSVTEIGKQAFNPTTVIVCSSNSTARQYALEAGNSVRLTDAAKPTAAPVSLAKAVVTVKAQVYTGKKRKPAVTVKLDDTKLTKGTDYTVSYKNNTAIGTATVTVKGIGGYTGTAKQTFRINPRKVEGLKLTAGSGKLTAKWKGASGVTGYQVQYATKKDFPNAKKVTVKNAAKTTIRSLKAMKAYYVRIRAYKRVDGVNYYSAWSDAIRKTTK